MIILLLNYYYSLMHVGVMECSTELKENRQFKEQTTRERKTHGRVKLKGAGMILPINIIIISLLLQPTPMMQNIIIIVIIVIVDKRPVIKVN